jgi:hypothetical protein
MNIFATKNARVDNPQFRTSISKVVAEISKNSIFIFTGELFENKTQPHIDDIKTLNWAFQQLKDMGAKIIVFTTNPLLPLITGNEITCLLNSPVSVGGYLFIGNGIINHDDRHEKTILVGGAKPLNVNLNLYNKIPNLFQKNIDDYYDGHGYIHVSPDFKVHTIEIPGKIYLKISCNNANISFNSRSHNEWPLFLYQGDENVKKVRIEHVNSPANFVKQIISKSINRYKIYPAVVDKNLREKPDNKINDFSSLEKQERIMRAYLTQVESENIEEILNIHKKYHTAHRTEVKKWSVDFLSWSYIFCFGEYNYINFKDFSGNVFISGNNKIGKSAIIDILVMSMYGLPVRGGKKNIVNKKVKAGWLKCGITSGDNKYVITRKYAPNEKIEIFKNGNKRISQKDLTSVVGDYNYFAITANMLQSRQYIVDMTGPQRYALFTKMLGMEFFTIINKSVSQDIIQLEYKRKAINFSKVTAADHGEINRMKEVLEEKAAARIGNKKLRSVILEKKDSLNCSSTFIHNEKKRAQHHAFNVMANFMKPNDEDTKKIMNMPELNYDNVMMASAKNNISDLIISEGTLRTKYPFNELKVLVKNTQENITTSLKNQTPEQSLKSSYLKFKPCPITQYHLVAGTKNKKHLLLRKKKLENQLREIPKTKCLFDIKCKTCLQNKKILSAHVDEKEILERIKENDLQFNLTRKKEENDALKHNKAVQKEIDDFSAYQNIKWDYNIFVSKDARFKIRLFEIIDKYKKYKELLNKINILDKEIVSSAENTGAEEIKKLTVRYGQLEREDEVLLCALEKIRFKIQTKQEFIRQNTEKQNKHNALLEKIKIMRTYLKCINMKTGVPGIVLKSVLGNLSAMCNASLSDITDFTLDILVSGSSADIYTKSCGIDISAEMASGFQKFIIDLVFKSAMRDLSSIIMPDFLIIDEGFGCLDKENFVKVKKYMEIIKSEYKFLLIISHLIGIKEIADDHIVITLDKYSYVKHGKQEKHFRINETATSKKVNLNDILSQYL